MESTVSPADLRPQHVQQAHAKIRASIHETPLLTSQTLDRIVSTPLPHEQKAPRLRLFFKCENFQKIGAFKARGATHAVINLMARHGEEELRRRGVITHSSGNHAQALAMAASNLGIPAHIVMPSNAAPSKVAGTKLYTQNVYHCEPTSQAREAKAAEIVEKTGGAILVPPYNDVDVLLGQGTCALELNQQHQQLKPRSSLDLVISPLGGGGLLSGVVTYFSDQPHTRVFGAEPSFQGGDDGKRGLEASPPKRIETVQTATIADGLRTPVGPIPWRIFNSSSHNKMRKLEGIRSVTEEQIKEAMKLLMERMKLFVEPSACVGLAALLYDQEYRSWIASQQGVEEVWDVGVILTGGNTTIEAVKTLFQ